jgi:hypothetical protein
MFFVVHKEKTFRKFIFFRVFPRSAISVSFLVKIV